MKRCWGDVQKEKFDDLHITSKLVALGDKDNLGLIRGSQRMHTTTIDSNVVEETLSPDNSRLCR